jgi:hypothetical protein
LTRQDPITILTRESDKASSGSSPSITTLSRIGPSNAPASVYTDANSRIIDESLSGHTLELIDRQPLSLVPTTTPGSPVTSSSPITIYSESSFLLSLAIATAAGSSHSHTTTSAASSHSTFSGNAPQSHTSLYHILHHRAAPGMEHENPGQVLGREFYRMGCLGRLRWGDDGPIAGHVGAVETVLEGLEGAAEILS